MNPFPTDGEWTWMDFCVIPHESSSPFSMKICRERIYSFRNTLKYNYIWAERINAFPTDGEWTWMDFRVIGKLIKPGLRPRLNS